jgi:predicted nucleic acid-binding protein
VIPWIIDASITINWLLDDEQDRRHSIAIFQSLGERDILVPSLWVYEVANVLLVAHRRQRLTAEQIQQFLKTLSELDPQLHAPEISSASRVSKLGLHITSPATTPPISTSASAPAFRLLRSIKP